MFSSLKNVSTETVYDPVESTWVNFVFQSRGEQCDEDCPLRKVRGRICVSWRGLSFVCVSDHVSWCPGPDLPLCFISIVPVSSDTFPPPSFCSYVATRKQTEWEWGGGTPTQHVKAIFLYTHIHGDPVSACLTLNGAVVSHQTYQRTTAGSERTLTRGLHLADHRSSSADSWLFPSDSGCRSPF